MITVTRIQKLTLYIEDAKNAGPLLQILLDCFLGIAFSMTSKVAHICRLTLKMYLVFFSMQNLNYEIHHKSLTSNCFLFFFRLANLT